MKGNTSSPPNKEDFQSAIKAFIDERREAKFKGKEPDPDSASKYEYSNWLADAARRVGQIQAVTHVLKATHPDARGSSLHVPPDALPAHQEIGSHSLSGPVADDVVGNAAALDVFKFLKVEVAERRLLDWMQDADADLKQALHPDADTAEEWLQSFRSLVRSEQTPASHATAKQIYWCVDGDPSEDENFHLLQPLFSSSFAHVFHANISEVRFGEANKDARKAKKDGTLSERPYQEYRGLALRKLGGTKPQNISQLNSERGGANYLLASLPPSWKAKGAPSLLNTESALGRLWFEPGMRNLVRKLAAFLRTDPPSNKETRDKREMFEQAIGYELPVLAANIRAQLSPGWTRDVACELARCEQLWLDPDRTELPLREGHEAEDQSFIDDYHASNWPDEVAGRFANWLNARLGDSGVKGLGSSEYKHWAKQAIVEAQWPVPLQRRAPGVSS